MRKVYPSTFPGVSDEALKSLISSLEAIYAISPDILGACVFLFYLASILYKGGKSASVWIADFLRQRRSRQLDRLNVQVQPIRRLDHLGNSVSDQDIASVLQPLAPSAPQKLIVEQKIEDFADNSYESFAHSPVHRNGLVDLRIQIYSCILRLLTRLIARIDPELNSESLMSAWEDLLSKVSHAQRKKLSALTRLLKHLFR